VNRLSTRDADKVGQEGVVSSGEYRAELESRLIVVRLFEQVCLGRKDADHCFKQQPGVHRCSNREIDPRITLFLQSGLPHRLLKTASYHHLAVFKVTDGQ
jgi:hypothetical protein